MKNQGALLICVFALMACGDDDPNGVVDDDDDDVDTVGRDFALRIENIAPWTVLKNGTQTSTTVGEEGPAAVGEAFEIRFTAGNNHFVSFATMLGESNDWFFAPGPEGIPLYSGGVPISGDVTRFVRLWDAGTELDQEPGVGNATGGLQPMRNFGEVDPDALVREVAMTVRLDNGSEFVRPPTSAMIRVTLTPGLEQSFTLRIENVSNLMTLSTSQGPLPVTLSPVVWAVHRNPAPIFSIDQPARDNGLENLAEAGQPDPLGTALRSARGYATGLSPGVFVVHEGTAPLFAPGSPDYGVGLERLAEDGNQLPLRDALAVNPPAGVSELGTFDTPAGTTAAGPALPGQAFEVTVHGEPGDRLSFATMFGMSNDWFFATRPEGIELFFDDSPRFGDVTSEIVLYDLGSERDEELDVGPNTAPQQVAPDSGRPDPTAVVREVALDRYGVPEVLHLRVTLTPL